MFGQEELSTIDVPRKFQAKCISATGQLLYFEIDVIFFQIMINHLINNNFTIFKSKFNLFIQY